MTTAIAMAKGIAMIIAMPFMAMIELEGLHAYMLTCDLNLQNICKPQ